MLPALFNATSRFVRLHRRKFVSSFASSALLASGFGFQFASCDNTIGSSAAVTASTSVAQPAPKESYISAICAIVVDSILMNGCLALLRPVLNLLDPVVSAIVQITAPFLYDIYFSLYWRTQTPGEAAFGVRVVSADSKPLRWRQVLVRRLGHMSHMLVGDATQMVQLNSLRAVGMLAWPLFDKHGHCLHDTLAGTKVVYL